MSAHESLGPQFSEVPLSRLRAGGRPGEPPSFPEKTEDLDPDYAEEHTPEYEHFGGPRGYVSHLAQDIKEHGQESPLEVYHHPKRDPDGVYTLSDGHHRLAALHEAGAEKAKVLIQPYRKLT